MVYALLALAILIGILLIYAACKPDTFRIERSTTIQAPPEKIFPLIDDLHQWERWSPWEKEDPAIQRSYGGTAKGVGAVYEWKGNKRVGHGRMEIIASVPSSKVSLKIDFFQPMEAHNKIDFLITQSGNVSTLTHAMHGPSPYLSRLMTIFYNMDKMIGAKFEEGLASLKAIAEK